MTVDSIRDGIVIDHISAGCGMKLYHLLNLGASGESVAIMMNVTSRKMGRKDIIKVDGRVPLNLDVIGFVDPGVTVNIIRDGELAEKKSIGMPEKLVNVIRCKNPRCISSTEQELDQVFLLTNPARREYRCLYCETKAAGV